YTWNETLFDCFRFLRFFALPIESEPTVPKAIAAVLAEDKSLQDDYRKAVAFYARLTNPIVGLSIADLVDKPDALKPGVRVSVVPASTSREAELFMRLFPRGLPPGADLMRELVRAIRGGKVDLKPRPDSGWYDYQVYAL